MAEQSAKVEQFLFVPLMIILIQDNLNVITATSIGTTISMKGDDVQQIVSVHNDFRARENPSGKMQLIVSHCILNALHITIDGVTRHYTNRNGTEI